MRESSNLHGQDRPHYSISFQRQGEPRRLPCVYKQLNAVVQEYLMGELIPPRYHVNWELAHLHLARSCICYISICLNHPQRSGLSSSTYSRVHGQMGHPRLVFQPLRDYVLDHAPDHFSHLGPQIKSILRDIKILEANTQSHSRMWDSMCLSANRLKRCTTPNWPTSQHDFTLYILVAFGSSSILRKFLRRTGLRPKEGTNPLVYAAYFNKDEHARTLLLRGAKLNLRGWETDGFCQALPITVALQNHHHNIVTLFVAEGSPVPFHTFAMLYHRYDQSKIPSPIVKILLQTDDFAEATNSPLTHVFLRPLALFNCLLKNDINEQDFIVIIRRIIQLGYDPFEATFHRDTLLRTAVQQGHVAAIRYLLSLGITLPSDFLVTLNLERTQNAAQMIRELVENGANTLTHNIRGDSVLHLSIAAFGEHDALVTAKLLVAYGCNPLEANSRGDTPLRIAVKQGHVSVVHYLLSHGVPLPSNLLITSGLQGARNGARMIHHLVDKRANAVARTPSGDSVLHIVLTAFDEHDALETAKLLVDHGCDPRQANSRGITPLYIAVVRGHVSVIRYLLSLRIPVPSDLFIASISRRTLSDARIIRFLVGHGVDVPARTQSGDSVLHIVLAAFDEYDALETAKLLVLRGCDPLQANSRGELPLRIAVKRGQLSVVQYIRSLGAPLPSDLLFTLGSQKSKTRAGMFRYLIENGANALAHSSDGDSVLHIVLQTLAEHDALETTKLLVARGCDPFQANPQGVTPLGIALREGHVSVIHYLLSLGASLSSDLLASSSFWKTENRARMICDLVENGANALTPTSYGDYLLHISLATFMEREALETAKLLVTLGSDPLQANYRGKTPLQIAVERGYVSLARYLFSLGAPLPSDLLTTWNSRYMLDDPRMIRFLVENGIDVLARTGRRYPLVHTVMHHFLEDEALEMTRLLHTHGCDPLQAYSGGKTFIYIAIERGHVFLAYYLLSLGARLPHNALFIALYSGGSYMDESPGKSEMIHFLIDHGADVLARESNGDSVLHRAITAFPSGDPEALEVITSLVTRGCNPATPNTQGVTPLHVAVMQGDPRIIKHLVSLNAPLPPDILFSAIESDFMPSTWDAADVVRFLVNSGCDTRTRNDAGNTPLHVAFTRGHVAVVDYLLSLIDNDNPPSEDPLPAAELAPPHLRNVMAFIINGHHARWESHEGPPP